MKNLLTKLFVTISLATPHQLFASDLVNESTTCCWPWASVPQGHVAYLNNSRGDTTHFNPGEVRWVGFAPKNITYVNIREQNVETDSFDIRSIDNVKERVLIQYGYKVTDATAFLNNSEGTKNLIEKLIIQEFRNWCAKQTKDTLKTSISQTDQWTKILQDQINQKIGDKTMINWPGVQVTRVIGAQFDSDKPEDPIEGRSYKSEIQMALEKARFLNELNTIKTQSEMKFYIESLQTVSNLIKNNPTELKEFALENFPQPLDQTQEWEKIAQDICGKVDNSSNWYNSRSKAITPLHD